MEEKERNYAYNWLRARTSDGVDVLVRQVSEFSVTFLDERGNVYDFGDLNFAVPVSVPHGVNQDENAYWRDLRVSIFMSLAQHLTLESASNNEANIPSKIARNVESVVDELYLQQRDFERELRDAKEKF